MGRTKKTEAASGRAIDIEAARESAYEFTLILDGFDELTPEVVDALYGAGCDDATVGRQGGASFADFDRVAPSLEEAILSAIRDVRSAGFEVLRVEDAGLVTQSDIARRMGRTRQLVHQYINGDRGPGGFPAPACRVGEGLPLWHWSDVATWLREHCLIREDEAERARLLREINCVLDYRRSLRVAPELGFRVLGLGLGESEAMTSVRDQIMKAPALRVSDVGKIPHHSPEWAPIGPILTRRRDPEQS